MENYNSWILGEPFENEMFIPIGSYYIFENDKLNVLDTDAVSSQVQDVVLREPITHMKSVEDIKEGHSMSNYLEMVVKMNKVRPSDNIKEVKQCHFSIAV